MSVLTAPIQQTRDELRLAFKQAEGDAATQARIQSKLEDLADLQEDADMANLTQQQQLLNDLSDLLDAAIADIRANIAGFLLANLEAVQKSVNKSAGKPSPVPSPQKPAAPAPGGPMVASPAQPPAAPVAPAVAGASPDLAALQTLHGRFPNSIRWSLTPAGLSIDGAAPENTGGSPTTVSNVWATFSQGIVTSSLKYSVPVELIVATICTESSGRADAIRLEPGYVSDDATPGRVSPGLMQTLISTARAALHDQTIDRAWLFNGDNSIAAGTAYIHSQRGSTGLDPPIVACAYNAGSVIENTSGGNRWRMRQFPIGTSEHCDRFVKWFNDAFRFFAASGSAPPSSFYRMLNP